ncbi:MAG: DUF697 domain-containing protein [Bacillota bacterium]
MENNQDFLKGIAKVGIKIGIGLLILLTIIIFNQTVQIVNFMNSINPILGKITLVLLIVLFASLLMMPLVGFFRYKRGMELPENEESEEFQQYLQQTRKNMTKNKYLKQEGFQFDLERDLKEEVLRAYGILDEKARTAIKGKATGVFLTTAISQNGVLDGFFVLGTLTKMIWELAALYEVRPSFTKMLALYGNVAATVLMARGVEDLDLLDEQIEPLVASILGGGMATLVPGAVTVTNIIVNSITEGSVNSLLTLRVGCITQRYLSTLTKPDKRSLRRSATIEAISMLGSVMKDNTVTILKAFSKGATNAAKNTVRNTFRF